MLRKPEQGDGVAHLATRTFARIHLGERAFRTPDFAAQHEGLQHVRPQRLDEAMRADQGLGQAPGRAERGDRGAVTTPGHFEATACVVQVHFCRRLGLRPKGAGGVPEPPLPLRQPALGDHRAAEHRVRDRGDGLIASRAVVPAQSPACCAARRG